MADAGRVVAGSAAGRRLRAPGPGTRPLADRVKQTLFAILEPDLPGADVLDLFAGSGAAGIEALSRGARRVVFVELDIGASRTIEQNLQTTGLGGSSAVVVRDDVLGWLRRASERGPFDLVIVDPPYADVDVLRAVLDLLGEPDAPLGPGARVVSKHFWRDRPPERIGLLASERERRFGETTLTFHRRIEERE
ncbi:MAG: 16S rRNA (guanine(966)-N(2))-methyltransferase RsmD [Chloroflexi bacterium]|nr:16S rRNA (guanine(966)-N(2))-methyltransferase RsmD [Chloroflexota bacterium]